ncbi:MAG: HIRAN domain-containing protein [Muribaculaceae bacterium]|nr:HIRAN domain-containing protein [Muribaculaceae bacterium]
MELNKAYLLDTYVAGRQFYDADDVWRFLSVGERLMMKWEPDNRHDRFAVGLWFEFGDRKYKLGYLPRSSNEFVAVMLAMGWEDAFECVISRIDGTAPFEKQIGVTVKVLRCRPPLTT